MAVDSHRETEAIRDAAVARLRAGDWDKALDLATRLSAALPDSAVAHLTMGTASQNLSRDAEALRSLGRAIRLGENRPKAFLRFHRACLKLGRHAEFLPHLGPFMAALAQAPMRRLVLTISPRGTGDLPVHAAIAERVAGDTGVAAQWCVTLDGVRRARRGEPAPAEPDVGLIVRSAVLAGLLATPERPLSAVTLAREPVARLYSAFCQAEGAFLVERYRGDGFADPAGVALRLQRYGFKFLDATRRWYRDELLGTLGLDVFAGPSPRETGFAHTVQAAGTLTVLRMEDLDRHWGALFDALALPGDPSAKAPGAPPNHGVPEEVYQRLVKDVPVGQDVVDSLYEQPETRWLYAGHELRAALDRWRALWKDAGGGAVEPRAPETAPPLSEPVGWKRLRNEARRQMKEKNWLNAHTAAMRLLTLDPAYPDAHLTMGVANLRLDRDEEARRGIARAILLGRYNFETLKHYRRACLRLRRCADFIPHLPSYVSMPDKAAPPSHLHLVLTPQKTASQTVYRAIHRRLAGMDGRTAEHGHFLRLVRQVCRGDRFVGDLTEDQVHRIVQHAHIVRFLDTLKWPLSVVTLTREPVARLYSAFCYIEKHFVTAQYRDGGFVDPALVAERFARFGRDLLDDYRRWYREELLEDLGLDVFAGPSPRGTGFAHSVQDAGTLTVVRSEDLDRCWYGLFETLGLPRGEGPAEARINAMPELGAPDEVYRLFQRTFPVERELIDGFYNTPETRWFYADHELDAALKRWRTLWDSAATPAATPATVPATAFPQPSRSSPSAVDVSQPMLLISQIQRSGGSLMAHLFDGHPQVYAHPHELHIGKPAKWNWPDLDLAAKPEVWFDALQESGVMACAKRGTYRKAGRNVFAQEEEHLFLFDPGVARTEFLRCVARLRPETQRRVLDCYFTAFFAAWQNHSRTGKERYVSAFCPRVLMVADSVTRFVRDYPDGRILSVVRDPRSWYASAKRHDAEMYGSAEAAIRQWRDSTQAILSYLDVHDAMVAAVSYEDLTRDVDRTMGKVAAWLGIDHHPILTVPTHAGRAKLPNSSFPMNDHGIKDTTEERLRVIGEDERAYIEIHAMPLYREALARVL